MTIVIDGTTGISGVDGTASNPSYEGTDSNTGIFYPAADTVAIGTGGTERVRVSSAGVVGVNTTSPAAIGANYGTIDIRGSSGGGFNLGTTGTLTGQIYGNSSGITYDAQGATSHFWYANGAERARITSGGDFLFGKTATDVTNPGAFFESSSLNYGRLNFVKGTASGTGATAACAFYYNNSAVGSITNTSTATAYNTSSDYRLKENVQPMTGALAKVAALKPVTYTWKLDGSASEGFIAHELAEVCPQAVTGEKDSVETYTDEDGNEQTRPAYQGIDTSFLVATLTAAIQELKAIVDAQAVEIAALKAQP
jgi:hypothetical protein